MTEENADFTFKEGKYAGMTAKEVAAYAESLEQAVGGERREDPPKKEDPPPVAKTAEERLVDDVTKRTSGLQLATAQRLEQDDEASFSATVSDYAKYKEKIDLAKKNLNVSQRMTRGVHEWLYGIVKMQDPEVKAQIYGRPAPEKQEEEPPKKEEEPPKKQEEPPKRNAAPAPPAARGTPASREPEKKNERKPKLVASDKIKRFVSQAGRPLETYLLELEDKGFTQDMLDNEGAPVSKLQRRQSVYDRS